MLAFRNAGGGGFCAAVAVTGQLARGAWHCHRRRGGCCHGDDNDGRCKLLRTEEWAARMREWQPRERSSWSSGRGGKAKHRGKPPVQKRMVGTCCAPLTATLAASVVPGLQKSQGGADASHGAGVRTKQHRREGINAGVEEACDLPRRITRASQPWLRGR